MFHHESTDAEYFEHVILQAVRQILASPDPSEFLTWARSALPALLGLAEAQLDELEQRRLATLLGTVIWNATPQPTHGFRPTLMEPQLPNSACSCGSGLRYRDCCGNLDEMPRLSTELVWEVLLDEIPERALRDALASGEVPAPLLAKVADRWLDEDRPGRAVSLLEPLFADALEELDGRFEPALDVLCDAYDRLDHWRKKRAFLDRVCNEGSRDLKAAAWQRRSTIHIDEGDFSQAEAAFTAALRNDPDNPSTALLEITLLAAQHKDALARERARFWLHRFRRLGFRDEGFMDFLARALLDPQEAMVNGHADALDPVLMHFHDWIDIVCSRALPAYRVEPIDEPRIPLNPAQAAERQAPVDAESASAQAGVLAPPKSVRRSELLWRSVFPAEKPNSTHLAADDEIDLWSEPAWLEHLAQHPELADSVDVLDDLANALYVHPESSLPWVAHSMMRPLLDRASAIIEQSVPRGCGYSLPWAVSSNRPALRLMFRRYLGQLQEGEHERAITSLETLLELNPHDNHGVRAELMNHYLRDGEDERALALARRFPDDALADLAYGEVLALYRLGRQDRARAVLKTAIRRMPRIPQYLTRKRIKQPRLSPFGITPGGDDQAWLYREAMRDVWAAEPGILDWLKQQGA